MKKYSLTTEVSSLNSFSAVIIAIIIVAVLIYNISILYYFGIILSTTATLLIYFSFFKSKNKIIEFTENDIFIDDKIISIKNIKSIEKGKILYKEGNSEIIVNFEFNNLEDNFYLLEKFWNTELSKESIINNS